MGILDDQGQGAPKVILFNIPHVNAIVGDGTAGDLVKTVDQVDDGSFSGSGGAYEGDLLPRLGVKADVV